MGWSQGGELGRLFGDVERLQRPPTASHGLAEWDPYWSMPDVERRFIQRNLMARTYDGPDAGSSPDDLADLAGYDLNEWWQRVATAVRVQLAVRERPVQTDIAELAIRDLIGPAEVADMLAVGRDTIRQWRLRRILPPADLVRSGMDLWRSQTILDWARVTGREPVYAHHESSGTLST